jgi:3',5'-cyclic AMP phosphodiesterase CpdA
MKHLYSIVFVLALLFSAMRLNSQPKNFDTQKFTFAIISDAHFGPDDTKGEVAINARRTLEQAVEELNTVVKPAFTVSLGDVVNVFEPKSVDNFKKSIKKLKNPLYLVHGNHDSHFPFTEYTNISDLYYSFDAGKWHFVVTPES